MKMRLWGAMCVLALAGAGAAQATVLTFETSPVGGPPVGVDAYNPATQPYLFHNGVVVDDGTGNHVLQLPASGGLSFANHTDDATTIYFWQLNSFQIRPTVSTPYTVTGLFIFDSGNLSSRQWATFNYTAPENAPFFRFGNELGNTILIDNIDYTLVRTQPQPPPIPEPQTWALMIAGLGMVGAALRRRRVRVAAT